MDSWDSFEKITYLIGNGFDKSVGLKTGYQDFYQFYTQLPSDNEIIAKLKTDICSDTDLWSDLEIQLGKYSENFVDHRDYQLIFNDISDCLKEYLKEQDKIFIPTQEQKDRFAIALRDPGENLPQTNQDKLYDSLISPLSQHVVPPFKKADIQVYVVSFNYTSTLYKLMAEPEKGSLLEYIHGNLMTDIILGVDNESQVSNQQLLNDLDTKSLIIKPEYNKALENGKVELIKDLINEVNVVVIVGMSLGETDKIWWNTIAEWLNDEKTKHCLVINWYCNNLPEKEIQRASKRREVKEKFFNLVDCDNIKIMDRIFVRLNYNFL